MRRPCVDARSKEIQWQTRPIPSSRTRPHRSATVVLTVVPTVVPTEVLTLVPTEVPTEVLTLVPTVQQSDR